MGWFDKKSWQLRRTIRDLQSELAVAERDGKYVVEQGLFFAELKEMPDSTMMVLGAADQLDSGEEDVIRNFFERNGFSVELLRLDKTHKNLAAVEIIPPEELTKRVALGMQERGYRLIDDSDQERPTDIEKKSLTLSALLRTISALFAGHVHQLIISTPIKLNMEGNRLLHWMPRIRDVQLSKVPPQLAAECVEPFVEAYNHYYGQFGKLESTDTLREFTETNSVRDVSGEMQFEPANSAAASWARSMPPASAEPAGRAAGTATLPTETPPLSTNREATAARTLAHMYRSLIGASDQRKVRNSETLLDDIARFFDARSACILIKASADGPMRLHANSGSSFCIQTTENGIVSCESETISRAMESGTIVVSQPKGNGNTDPATIAIPLSLDNGSTAILYIVEPEDFSQSLDSQDVQHAMEFSRVFREYPDLLL